MNGLIGLGGTLAILLVMGTMVGLTDRERKLQPSLAGLQAVAGVAGSMPSRSQQ